jgi:hypothetical protein
MTDEIPDTRVPGALIVRTNLVGTAVFVVTLAFAVPWRDARPAQFVVAAVSMALFAVGVVTALLAYAAAVERSRTEEIGVANLYLLTGPVAPVQVKRAMHALLAVQIAAALGGASVGMVGLDEGQLNALAFGILVPMLGVGLNGLWAARHGSHGPRVDRRVAPSNERIG